MLGKVNLLGNPWCKGSEPFGLCAGAFFSILAFPVRL